jgi:catalase
MLGIARRDGLVDAHLVRDISLESWLELRRLGANLELTSSKGCPIASPNTAQTFCSENTSPYSSKSLVLLQDTQLIETLAHFSRERIPERVVHASAVGAWGDFEVTKNVTHLTCAKIQDSIGKKVKVLLRVSTTGPDRGGAETQRDVRGWAMKIFTDEGNEDFVFNDIVSTLMKINMNVYLRFV